MNQFAKISPLVTSYGELLKQDVDGNYTIKSGIYLKRNETGICVEDRSIICMYYNGRELEPIKLIGGHFKTTEEMLEYISNNIDGSKNGEIISPIDSPRSLYIVNGTNLYNVTENNTKTVRVTFNPGTDYDDGIVISNSDIGDSEEYMGKKYLINTVDIFSSNMYQDQSGEINIGIMLKSKFYGSEFPITTSEEEITKTDRYSVNEEFSGPLKIQLAKYTFNVYENIIYTPLSSFSLGYPITVSITYTPIH